jgi:hypothetical protein
LKSRLQIPNPSRYTNYAEASSILFYFILFLKCSLGASGEGRFEVSHRCVEGACEILFALLEEGLETGELIVHPMFAEYSLKLTECPLKWTERP